MLHAAGYLLFKALPAATAVLFEAYLLYATLHAAQPKPTASTHRVRISAHSVPKGIHSTHFLVAWSLITLALVSGVIYDLCRGLHIPLVPMAYLLPIVSIAAFSLGLYVWSAWLRSGRL